MSRSGMWHYHCLVRHGFLKALQLSASFLQNFESLSCIWHWVAENSELSDYSSLIINKGLWIPEFQWSATEDCRAALWWHLIKTLKRPSQSSDNVEAWFVHADGTHANTPNCLQRKSLIRILKEQQNMLTWKDTACIRWTITQAVFLKLFINHCYKKYSYIHMQRQRNVLMRLYCIKSDKS